MFWFRLAAGIALAIVIVYTASYGVWEWRHNNRAGAWAVFALCAVAAALPIIRMIYI